MSLPRSVQLNAWRNGPVAGPLARDAAAWGADDTGVTTSQQALDFGAPADLRCWTAPDVGYGVLLPDNDQSPEAKASGADAPEPVRRLLERRPGTVVLRWAPDVPAGSIRRYYADGSLRHYAIGLTPFGIGRDMLPHYVVIIAGPEDIPWRVQYEFENMHAVGRLPLTGAELANYLTAMHDGWPDAPIKVDAPVIWTVSKPKDITALMRAVITEPLAGKLAGPKMPGLRHLTEGQATGEDLLDVLKQQNPGLLVTSSHGLAAGRSDVMRASLGTPIDCEDAIVDLAGLVEAVPYGTFWYSQACCSAGSDATTNYDGLLPPGQVLDTLQAVAELGATVAPAPLHLLGRKNPIRGFLGHVEPTFDWTLRVKKTGQYLGADIGTALSSNLFFGQPIGLAFAKYRTGVGELNTLYATLSRKLTGGDDSVLDELTRLRVAAIDRQSLVLLGDPTVTMPPLPAV
jgi:hypothetical protein